MLGDDLRNPLAAINSGAHARQLLPLDDRASKVVKLIRWSNSRMSEPINNISDFAQGRMGRGLAVSRVVDPAPGSMLQHVISELQSAWPQRAIESRIEVGENISGDSARIAQLLSNLVSNALKHGDSAGVVDVTARSDSQVFRNSSGQFRRADSCADPRAALKAFSRTSIRGQQRGIGLGLYIGGRGGARSRRQARCDLDSEVTRFMFRMPVSGSPA